MPTAAWPRFVAEVLALRRRDRGWPGERAMDAGTLRVHREREFNEGRIIGDFAPDGFDRWLRVASSSCQGSGVSVGGPARAYFSSTRARMAA